jgi:hypothetical protein
MQFNNIYDDHKLSNIEEGKQMEVIKNVIEEDTDLAPPVKVRKYYKSFEVKLGYDTLDYFSYNIIGGFFYRIF